jgi:hypothetical protein
MSLSLYFKIPQLVSDQNFDLQYKLHDKIDYFA